MDKKNILIFTILLILLIGVQLLFGCTLSPTDEESLKKFTQLQEKYGVNTAFSTNLTIMNDYTTDLAALRGSVTGSNAKIIEAELYSAQAFYYYNNTVYVSRGVDYQNINCNAKATKDTISSITIAKEKATQAIATMQTLSSDQLSKLRPNQLDDVKKYQIAINGISDYFEEKC